MRSETITLGEREYTLGELPIKPARLWRNELKNNFGHLLDLVETAPNVEINDMRAVSAILRTLSATLLDSVDLALELLLKFSPALEGDREYIENNALGSQVVDGFLAAISLAFPFFGGERIGKLTRTIQQIGSQNKAT